MPFLQRIFSCLVPFALLSSSPSLPAGQSGYLEYSDDGEFVTIDRLADGSVADVFIPAEIDGKIVVAIGNGAFAWSGVRSIDLPDTLKRIGSGAFTGCVNLEGVNLPESVVTIERQAFSGSSISFVTLPSELDEIGVGAFYGCYYLGDVKLPSGLREIPDGLFERAGLGSIDIPDSVVSIGGYAFYSCGMDLTRIPASVTNIGNYAFNGQVSQSLVFEGDAPVTGQAILNGTVYYMEVAAGFTTPTWRPPAAGWFSSDWVSYSAFPGIAPRMILQAPFLETEVGQMLDFRISYVGLPAPHFSVVSGSLPPGISLGDDGHIAGVATKRGVYSGEISAANGIYPSALQAFTIVVNQDHTLMVIGSNGSVSGGGTYAHGSSVEISANPDLGFVFSGWSGDVSGIENPMMILIENSMLVRADFSMDERDNDGDGLTNYQEVIEINTDPDRADTDDDGSEDKFDRFPNDPEEYEDADGDGMGNNGDNDDDGDGLMDQDEIDDYLTNPLDSDTDGDGLGDWEEIHDHHTNPLAADSDVDGLNDAEEIRIHRSDPKANDTDGDGFLDGYEVVNGKSPLDREDKPALLAQARTALEFVFPSQIGRVYRIEASDNLKDWVVVEDRISGNGEEILRFFSIRSHPKRYFRVEDVTAGN